MWGSPIEEIAEMFDEKMPDLISEMVEVVDSSSKTEFMRWIGFEMLGKWDEDYYNENRHDLLVYIAAEFFEMSEFVQKEGYTQYDDYLMYVFFFAQYRKLTGKNLKKDMKFTDILSEYENITDDNLWKTFVYSDDPEGDRTYNLFLYDDYKLDFYEETTQLNYIDEEVADRCSELMHCSFSDDSISHIRAFDLVKYMDPGLVALLEDLEDMPLEVPFTEAETPQKVYGPKKIVKEYVCNRISGYIHRCVGNLYRNSDEKDNIREINKLDEDIQKLYGEVQWFDFERKYWIKANVPEYLTKEEFIGLVEENKKTADMISIYNYLFGIGRNEYIVNLVEYLQRVFCFVIENEMSVMDSEESAIEELFRLADRINKYWGPVFKVISREGESLKLETIKDPYSVRHQLDAAEELRLQIGLPPSDAWLLQEQIYLCGYRFEEFCMILHLLLVTLERSKDKMNAKRIANEYRYLFKNITNHIFQDFLVTDVFVENKKYSMKEKREHSNVHATSNILINSLLVTLDKMLQTDNLIELSEGKGMLINSLRVLGGDEELIEAVIMKLENALVEKCEKKSGFSEIYNEVKQEMKEFPVILSDTTINTLSTAEYFYKEYILNKVEREKFDYSCFVILYFQVLESALNELLFVPYKLRYETEIITYANSNGGIVDDFYCVPTKVMGLITRKNGTYCMAENLTLGALAFFCIGMEYNPDKRDLVRFARGVFRNPNLDVKKLSSFGRELLEISKIRNVAAHASENLPAESFIESKDYVFNKSLTRELRNMLRRFLEFFK